MLRAEGLTKRCDEVIAPAIAVVRRARALLSARLMFRGDRRLRRGGLLMEESER